MNYLNTVEDQSDHEVTYTVSVSNLEERVQQLESIISELQETISYMNGEINQLWSNTP